MNIAVILARGNSRRIKDKNIKSFCGKPMIYWPIKVLKKSKLFSKIYISTDSKKISKVGKKYQIETIIRPKKFSSSKTTTLDTIKYFLKQINIKNSEKICFVYASAPFFTVLDLNDAFKLLKKKKLIFLAKKIDSNFLRSFYLENKKLKMLNKKYYYYNSQDLKKLYCDLGQFYLAKASTWLKIKTAFFSSASFLCRSDEEYIDINTYADLKKAKKIFKSRKRY
jgi:pseudaminic acid cytidylyltransferase